MDRAGDGGSIESNGGSSTTSTMQTNVVLRMVEGKARHSINKIAQ